MSAAGLVHEDRPLGSTSESDVHRALRRRWWSALRLSTLPAPISQVAGFMGESPLGVVH